MFSVLSGHSVQPLTDSRHKMMEGLRMALPTAENHLPDLWPDLEKRLRPLLQPVSHILSLSNNCERSSTVRVAALVQCSQHKATSFQLRVWEGQRRIKCHLRYLRSTTLKAALHR